MLSTSLSGLTLVNLVCLVLNVIMGNDGLALYHLALCGVSVAFLEEDDNK